MKIVTAEEMRQIEQECASIGLPTDVLMENAGKAVAEEIKNILRDMVKPRIVILIGPGNNGGDGLVAARHLHDWGADVNLFMLSQREHDTNLIKIQQRGVTCISAEQDEKLVKFDSLLLTADCVIDSLFGTGKIRPLEGIIQQVLDRVNKAKRQDSDLRVIAVDLPSGLDADSGAVDAVTPYADVTITLGFPKPGLFRFPGVERAGKLAIADIGIPDYLAEPVSTELITSGWAKTVLPERPLNANKGSFGKVLVTAGSINYIGAAYLACSGAMRVGAGLVTLATASSLQPILASKLTEVTYLPLPEAEPGIIAPPAAETISQQFGQYQVLLIGCGLGQSKPVMKFISSLFLKPALPALVLDADVLNTLAQISHWWQELPNDAILTPHPGEMARLCGISVEEVQADRTGTARKAALEWRKTIVLKGAYTVIAAPDGRCRINPVANPGLASAGTGDVLAGAIAGLLAQGLSLYDAASLGVYLHAQAGETVKNTLGDTGMIASDLLPALPIVIKRMKGKPR